MNRRLLLLGSAILGIAALAACNGGGSGTTALPAIQCALPTGAQVALAYPINGAVGVPDSPGQVVVATTVALSNWQVVLALPNNALAYQALFVTVQPNAVPTPFATPSFGNPMYESSSLTSALTPATTFNVLLNNQSSTCNSYPIIGSFTTQ